jgi:endonuclease V-like protein UPF0215 family
VSRLLTNVIGFDDAPFERDHTGEVLLVGVVCSRTRLDGIVSGHVMRDGHDATERMIEVLRASQFAKHVRACLLQGIAVAGFNVVDVHALHEALGIPVLVVARRKPDLEAMKTYLVHNVADWEAKWRLVEAAKPMEPLRDVWVQRVGLDRESAAQLLAATTLHGNLPEALRMAHLIARGLTRGTSRGRA